MIRFGFELEAFLQAKKEFILAGHLPHDDCGYLVEARGLPHGDPMQAAYSMLAEYNKIIQKAAILKQKVLLMDFAPLSPAFVTSSLRKFGKNPIDPKECNIYGTTDNPEEIVYRAGLHVHFSNVVEIQGVNNTLHKVPSLLNIPPIVRDFDTAFYGEIVKAKRITGLYSMKSYGFEYRSLPATININRVANFISINKNKWF
jgi:hypothetical protein